MRALPSLPLRPCRFSRGLPYHLGLGLENIDLVLMDRPCLHFDLGNLL